MSLRISGMVSGLDIDKIVSDLMRARRAPLDKFTQQKTTLEWTREQYRSINSKIVDFRNNKLFNYGLSNSMNAKQVTISGNQTAVSAKAASTATLSSMTIEVNRLASAKSVASGVTLTAAQQEMTLAELRDANVINFTDDNGDLSLEINGKTVALSTSDKLSDMIAKINAQAGSSVTTFVDKATGKFSITAKATGSTGLSITDTNGLLAGFGRVESGGEDAEVKINGIVVNRSSNTFTENGVEITLNGLTTPGVPANLKVSTDTNKIMDTIKSFVNDYNNLLEAINGKLNEERFRKYPPLTDEQKKEMKEDEIKLWEERAKSGLLRNDSTLSGLASNFRLASITDVSINGTNLNLTKLGITTGDWTQRGKLVIDENKLRQAIEESPDQVIKFFTQQTKESDPKKAKSPANPDNGLFNRLSNVLMNGLEGLSRKAGTSRNSADEKAAFLVNSSMGEQLRLIDIRLGELARKMTMIETQYYKQFTAMEKAMNRYSAQSAIFYN